MAMAMAMRDCVFTCSSHCVWTFVTCWVNLFIFGTSIHMNWLEFGGQRWRSQCCFGLQYNPVEYMSNWMKLWCLTIEQSKVSFALTSCCNVQQKHWRYKKKSFSTNNNRLLILELFQYIQAHVAAVFLAHVYVFVFIKSDNLFQPIVSPRGSFSHYITRNPGKNWRSSGVFFHSLVYTVQYTLNGNHVCNQIFCCGLCDLYC